MTRRSEISSLEWVFLLITLPLAVAFGVYGMPYIVSTLWGWFVVPLGVPALSVAHAFGLILFTTLFRFDLITKAKEDADKGTPIGNCVKTWVVFFGGGLVLGVGYIAKYWVGI